MQQLNTQMHVLPGHTNVGIVIEGGALNMALMSGAQDALMALCRDCKAVVCCRVTPMQKAQVCCIGVALESSTTVALGFLQGGYGESLPSALGVRPPACNACP